VPFDGPLGGVLDCFLGKEDPPHRWYRSTTGAANANRRRREEEEEEEVQASRAHPQASESRDSVT